MQSIAPHCKNNTPVSGKEEVPSKSVTHSTIATTSATIETGHKSSFQPRPLQEKNMSPGDMQQMHLQEQRPSHTNSQSNTDSESSSKDHYDGAYSNANDRMDLAPQPQHQHLHHSVNKFTMRAFSSGNNNSSAHSSNGSITYSHGSHNGSGGGVTLKNNRNYSTKPAIIPKSSEAMSSTHDLLEFDEEAFLEAHG